MIRARSKRRVEGAFHLRRIDPRVNIGERFDHCSQDVEELWRRGLRANLNPLFRHGPGPVEVSQLERDVMLRESMGEYIEIPDGRVGRR